MSYDLQIWSPNLPDPAATLSASEGWQGESGFRSLPSRNWQILVMPSDKVLPEDIPEPINALLPGIRYLTHMHLEPIYSSDNARKKLFSAARKLAKQAHGIILDPQTDRITTPKGIRRFIPKKRRDRFSLLEMSWWFTQSPLLSDAGLLDWVSFMEKSLPETMPRRYGPHEPPKHLFAETGREHFIDYLLQNSYGLSFVWYPHRPVVGLSLGLDKNWGPSNLGFRANYLQISIEANVLEQPGWVNTLQDFWKQSAYYIQPFYGDIRILHGKIPMGGTYGSDFKTEHHPISGPWWPGIPRQLGHAIVLGEPYLSLRPHFSRVADVYENFAFYSNPDWKSAEGISKKMIRVPSKIAQFRSPFSFINLGDKKSIMGSSRPEKYPKIWPFDGPYEQH